MNLTRLLGFALKQTRRSRGRLAFSILAIFLGVAANTAVKTFSSSVERGIDLQSRNLMGADLRLESGKPISKTDPLTTSLMEKGASYADTTEFFTMLRVAHPKPNAALTTRLVRVRAVSPDFPFYGRITSEPDTAFAQVKSGDKATLLADPTLFPALDLKVGDRVSIGQLDFKVAGSIKAEAGSPGFSAGFGAPVYVHQRYLEDTGLLVTGSRIRYNRFFKLPESFDAEAWKEAQWKESLNHNITIYTYKEAASSVRRFVDNLSKFLTLAGLVILFLGGLGIGLAMNVFVKSRLDDIAIARSMGATPGTIMQAYIIVGAVLAIPGSIAGVVTGVLAAHMAANLGAGLLPVNVEIVLNPYVLLASGLPGLLVTMAFVLFPIFEIRKISPLRVLRKNAEYGSELEEVFTARTLLDRIRQHGSAILAFLTVSAVLIGVSIIGSESISTGLFFTLGVIAATGLLYAVSIVLTRLTKRLIPRIRSFRLRQGLANLHRPGNQTTTMLVSTGVGVLLIMTIFTLQSAVEKEISFGSGTRPNLFLIDIQPEQKSKAESIIGRYSPGTTLVPMISMRIGAINGERIDRSNIEKNANRRTWENSIRSYEYFGSYRNNLSSGEKLTGGTFWGDSRPERQEISVDERWAGQMKVSIGDVLSMEIQGLPLDAVVTSTRKVDWTAMQINSILLFSPGPIEQAPRMYVASLNLPEEKTRYAFQEEIVRAYPNITVIDANQAVQTVSGIAQNVAVVIRWMAALTLTSGLIILTGCIGSSRFARIKESVLLKTIGATRGDILSVLSSEYFVLGLLGAASGMALSQALAWPILFYFFDIGAGFPFFAAMALLTFVVMLTMIIGLLISIEAVRQKPLEILRNE